MEPPRGARPQGAGGTSMGGGRDSISHDPRQSRGLEIALEGHNTDKAPQGAANGSANCIADSWRPLKGLNLCLGILATRKRVDELLHTHLVRNFIFGKLF